MNNEFMESQKRIFEQWTDYFKQNSQDTFTPPNWEQFFSNPFASLNNTNNIFNELNKFYQDFQKSFSQKPTEDITKIFDDFIKQFSDNYNKLIFEMLGLPDYSSNPFGNFQDFWNNFNIFSSFNNIDFLKNLTPQHFGIFEKMFQLPSFGLTREYIELIKTVFNDYKNYMEQVDKFKRILSEQTKKGFELFLNDIKQQSVLDDFDTFFNKWVQKNEEVFQDFFKTEEYGTLLKELISAGAKFKKSIDEYYEAILKGTNIATKYELDRAYKEIYALKKAVKELKKQIKQLSEQQEKKATKKTSKKG